MKLSCLKLRVGAAFVYLTGVALVLSCTKEPIVNSTIPNKEYDNSTYQQILNLGFNQNSIIDYGKYYLVEGDIRFWKTAAVSPNARPSQRAVTQYKLPNLSSVGNITVRVDNNFPNSTFRNNVITAVQTACSRWNGINSAVNFTYTSGSTATIVVGYESNLPSTQYGAGDYPVGCETGSGVGPTLGISTNAGNLTSTPLAFVLTHELGHTIGLAHTDQGALSYQIFGTPTSDSNSIMQSGPADGISSNPLSVPTRSSFTTGDQNAVKFLFPAGGATVTPIYNSQGDPSNPIQVTWTPSQYCNLSMDVEIYYNDTFVKSITQTFNDGLQTFSTSQLTSGNTYTFKVHPHGDTLNVVISDTQINFP